MLLKDTSLRQRNQLVATGREYFNRLFVSHFACLSTFFNPAIILE